MAFEMTCLVVLIALCSVAVGATLGRIFASRPKRRKTYRVRVSGNDRSVPGVVTKDPSKSRFVDVPYREDPVVCPTCASIWEADE